MLVQLAIFVTRTTIMEEKSPIISLITILFTIVQVINAG